jgi:hypothetical protein
MRVQGQAPFDACEQLVELLAVQESLFPQGANKRGQDGVNAFELEVGCVHKFSLSVFSAEGNNFHAGIKGFVMVNSGPGAGTAGKRAWIDWLTWPGPSIAAASELNDDCHR